MAKKIIKGKTIKARNMSTMHCLRWVARIFILILTLASIFWLYACIPLQHMQNGREHITSFQKAAHWWIYYYLTTMYIPAWILSFSFLSFAKKVTANKPTAKAEASSEQENVLIQHV